MRVFRKGKALAFVSLRLKYFILEMANGIMKYNAAMLLQIELFLGASCTAVFFLILYIIAPPSLLALLSVALACQGGFVISRHSFARGHFL